MITKVSSLRTSVYHISHSYWTIYDSFEIILESALSIEIQIQMFYASVSYPFSKQDRQI